jgi:hypothetical protein
MDKPKYESLSDLIDAIKSNQVVVSSIMAIVDSDATYFYLNDELILESGSASEFLADLLGCLGIAIENV